MPIYGKCKTCGRETIDYLCGVCLVAERDKLREWVIFLRGMVEKNLAWNGDESKIILDIDAAGLAPWHQKK